MNMDQVPPKSRRKARCRKAGTLLKWVNYVSGWQKRYFDLVGGTLSYYKSSEDVVAGCRGSVLLRETSIQHVGPREMILTAGSTNYHLRASSEQDLMTWITALELAKQEETKAHTQKQAHESILSNGAPRHTDTPRTAVGAAMVGLQPSPLGTSQGNINHPVNTSGSGFHSVIHSDKRSVTGNTTLSSVDNESPQAASTPGVFADTNISAPISSEHFGGHSGAHPPYRKHTRAGSSGSNRSFGAGGFRRTDSNDSLASTFSDASDFSEHSSNYSGSHRHRDGVHSDTGSQREVGETVRGRNSNTHADGVDRRGKVPAPTHEPCLNAHQGTPVLLTGISISTESTEVVRGTDLVVAEDCSMDKVQRASKLFANASAQYVATCDRMLVGPEPDVEAEQDIYIETVKVAQKRIGDAITRIIHEGVTHRATLAQSISQSDHACRAAATRVYAMQQAIDRLRRVVQANQNDLADGPPPAGRLDGDTDSGTISASHRETIGAAVTSPPTPMSRVRKSSRVQRTPKELTNADRLQKILSPRTLPNRPVTASHRRSMSDPLLAGTFAAAMTKSTVDETAPIQCDKIDIDLANSEKQPITAEDTAIMQRLIAEIGAEKLRGLSARDYMQIIRGYKTSTKRFEETIDATRKIVKWRDEVYRIPRDGQSCSLAGASHRVVHFATLVKTFIPEAEKFHSLWRETVYGEDCFGHPVVGIRVADIDTQALGAIPETALVQLVAQKLAVYRDYMEFLSAQRGEQRYKLSYLIDMSNAGVSSLLGDKKTLMQKIFGVGSTYFPESVWKIYVVNAPFTLRMGWSVVKALIHPVTEAKIKIVGSVSDAKSRLARDGFSPAALPKEFGGTNAGLPVWSLLQTLQQAYSHPEANEHSVS